MLLMQGDFTDQPEHIPDWCVDSKAEPTLWVGERTTRTERPHAGRQAPPARSRRAAALAPVRLGPWRGRSIRALFRLNRNLGHPRLNQARWRRAPIVFRPRMGANVDLLSRAIPSARRVETVSLEQRFDIRPRPAAIRPFADAVNLYRFRLGDARSPFTPPSTAAT
jgi:hypothetical protein